MLNAYPSPHPINQFLRPGINFFCPEISAATTVDGGIAPAVLTVIVSCEVFGGTVGVGVGAVRVLSSSTRLVEIDRVDLGMWRAVLGEASAVSGAAVGTTFDDDSGKDIVGETASKKVGRATSRVFGSQSVD